MSHQPKAIFSWSGGKDSALALQHILQGNQYEVVALLTMLNEETLQSSVHAIPLEILYKQAESIGIPLHTVTLAENLKGYNEVIGEAARYFAEQGVTHFIYGDIFLTDVQTYRKQALNPYGIELVEPLWGKSSSEIIAEFLQSGIQTKIVVTQADKLDASYIGKDLNRDLIASLPEGVDVCGENGEYHTLAYAGGLFKKPVAFSLGSTQKLSYDINLSDGQTKTFEYWQAPVIS